MNNGDEYHRVISLRHDIPLDGDIDAVKFVEEADRFSDESIDVISDVFNDLASFIRNDGKNTI